MIRLPPLVVSQREEQPPALREEGGPTYGVWCVHEQRWEASGERGWTEKEAWWALLETDSPHPRELMVLQVDPHNYGRPVGYSWV
jgi:hypothetical protein